MVHVLATPSNVAKPSDAGISEEEDTAIPVTPARMATRHTPVDETKPLVVGDWLSDKDILARLNDKLYHNEIEEPRAWTWAVTYIVSYLKMMRNHKDSKGTNHTIVRLAWRRRHIFIVNSDDRKGLHWFLCAINCRVPVWAFKVHIWEPLCGNSLVRPMLKCLQSKGVAAHAQALGFQEDGWSCGYQSLHSCDDVAGHRGSLDNVDVTPLPKGFIKEALCIINADRSVRVPGTILENGWEGEVICREPGESPPALASNPESLPPSTSPLLFDEEDPLSEPEGNIAASSLGPTVGEYPAFPASNSEDVPQDGKSVKGNVNAPPQTPESTSSSNPPTSDDARPYVFIHGKLVEVPEAYPKGVEGQLVLGTSGTGKAMEPWCEGWFLYSSPENSGNNVEHTHHDHKQKMQFALQPLASGIKMTMLLPAPPATKLKLVIPPESGHLGPTTFFACNHNAVGPTTRSRQTHACRSNQILCPMPSALHADSCSAHRRHGYPSQATLPALE